MLAVHTEHQENSLSFVSEDKSISDAVRGWHLHATLTLSINREYGLGNQPQ